MSIWRANRQEGKKKGMKQEIQYKENPQKRQHYGEKGQSVIRFLEGVTRIGAYAFGECREITEITMPKSLQLIEGHAFYNCRGLHTIRFLGAVPEIEDGAFKNCSGIRQIELFEAEERDIRLKNFLPELEQELSVRLVFASGEEARLCLPRISYAFIANEPARMFTEESYGSGVYYRQCVGRSEIDWRRYDELFPMACREETIQTVLSIARKRLEFPYHLTENSKDKYLEYIDRYMPKVLEEIARSEDWELLSFLCRQKLITKPQTEFGIAVSNQKERPYMASCLLEYGRTAFAAARRRMEL